MKDKIERINEAEETKDVNILEFIHNRKMMTDQNIKVFDNFLTVHEILAFGCETGKIQVASVCFNVQCTA